MFERGIFCVSFDFELAWGTFDVWPLDVVLRKARLTRDRVLPRFFELLSKYDVSATWAIVGHLMLDSCEGEHGRPYPDHSWFPDWYQYDIGGDETNRPEWYAKSIVKEICKISPPQDIGLHGFSHCIWNDSGVSEKVLANEMKNCAEACDQLGITALSFVFPRNKPGNYQILKKGGIKIYRSPMDVWYQSFPAGAKKVLHILSQLFALTPKTVLPAIKDGLVAIPSSHLYLSMDGFRRVIPISSRVRGVKKGIKAAAKEKKVFHLYLHPENYAYDDVRSVKLLDGFEEILRFADNLRKHGDIEILNMSDIYKKTLEARRMKTDEQR